jgi:hypothetical protein
MRQNTFTIQTKNPDYNDEVILTESQIKLILLEARGFNQHDAAKQCMISHGTAHNALIDVNSQTGCRNAQGRVGWALLHRVIVIENKQLVIAPEYTAAIPKFKFWWDRVNTFVLTLPMLIFNPPSLNF